jgi:hypothetical protein
MSPVSKNKNTLLALPKHIPLQTKQSIEMDDSSKNKNPQINPPSDTTDMAVYAHINPKISKQPKDQNNYPS